MRSLSVRNLQGDRAKAIFLILSNMRPTVQIFRIETWQEPLLPFHIKAQHSCVLYLVSPDVSGSFLHSET